MSSTAQLFPEVKDVTNVGAHYSLPFFLPLGVEGQADVASSGTVGVVYSITRPVESDGYFGAASPLGLLVKYLLGRGVAQVYAVASVKSVTTPPTLIQRQAAWATLESHPSVRLRMTDDTSQATLVALAQSCGYANQIYNKQTGFGGMPAGTTKASLIAAAQAINHNRFVLVGPGVIDPQGNLFSGNYAAASVAALVSQNPDISDDLDLEFVPNLAGIEMGANGLPLFAERVSSGVSQNDFEDLLQAGVSPLMTDRSGLGVRITHLRMTYTVDRTFDALETRLIIDQVFEDVRQYATNNKFLRRGNTPATRADLAAGVSNLLAARQNWVQPVIQADGTPGYNVAVSPTPDFRGVQIFYQGIVVRNIQTILVDAQLTISV